MIEKKLQEVIKELKELFSIANRSRMRGVSFDSLSPPCINLPQMCQLCLIFYRLFFGFNDASLQFSKKKQE